MVGSITVDAFTLLDLVNELWVGNFEDMPDVFASFWAMQYNCPNCLGRHGRHRRLHPLSP